MDSAITPLDQIKACINANQNFVLQGGAGSGKTETLKQVMAFIAKEYPDKKAACITHTNLAANEIKSRVGEQYTISTIHSFLHHLIKDFKKNIHQVIFEIFRLATVQRQDLSFYAGDKKVQKIDEHYNFKSLYKKYAKVLYAVNKVTIPSVTGKRVYDKDPEKYNDELNQQITQLNDEMQTTIAAQHFNQIKYNETKFDRFKDLTHLRCFTFNKWPKQQKNRDQNR
jgi:DNA helicase-2/ATP-dependent DNA helicase PcrA